MTIEVFLSILLVILCLFKPMMFLEWLIETISRKIWEKGHHSVNVAKVLKEREDAKTKNED